MTWHSRGTGHDFFIVLHLEVDCFYNSSFPRSPNKGSDLRAFTATVTSHPMRFLFFPLFTLLSVISAQADSVPAPNPPKVGKYVGVATITKDFFPERMSTKVTVRAYANVFNNSGDLSIMAVVPESPMAAAANPESTISRGVWQPDGTYLMDGKHRATLTLVGDSFQLSFASPAPTFSGGTGPLEGSFPDGLPEIIPAATTRIHYRFYPQTQASTRRAR